MSAALQLLPLATWLADELGELLTCNESFADRAGVPSSLLMGREWWQAFASSSEEIARALHRSLVASTETRGDASLQLHTADGLAWDVELAWKRLSEPGTRRPLWVLTATHWRSATGPQAPVAPGDELLRASDLALLLTDNSVKHPMEVLRALANRAPLQPSRSPATVLTEAVALLPTGARKNALRIITETTQRVAGHRVDAARIVALVLARAFRDTPADRAVELRAFDEPGHVCFSVHEFGADPTSEELAAANAPLGTGTTLHPLAFVRALAQALGGSFRWGREPSGGSLLVLSLPSDSRSG